MLHRRLAATLLAVLASTVVACGTFEPPASSPGSSRAAPSSAAGTGAPATLGASASPSSSARPVDLAHLAVSLEPFTKVDGGPLDIATPDDGSGRLFVVAQDGRIWVVDASGTVRSNPMVDLGDRLTSGGEQGLLGLALHPGFASNPLAFVNYTNKDGDSVIASLTIDPNDKNRLDPNSLQQILFLDQPFANHNGGDLLFGPDGYLYAFFGDGGSGGDPQGNGQNSEALLGKVLRLDIDHPSGDLPYSAPAGNPFLGGAGRDEIWLLGMRNPWRASFDRATGDLWIGDVGQSAWEEVDVARAGVGGLNFGWNRMEGNHCYAPGAACSTDNLTIPVTEYSHDLGCTIIGGYVYRGSKYPALAGAYLFADYCSGRIFAIDPSTDTFRAPIEVGNGGTGISSFGEDAAGELYVTNLDGDISRVAASTRSEPGGRRRPVRQSVSDLEWIRLLAVDADLLHALRRGSRGDVAGLRECRQRRGGDARRVDLEPGAKRVAGVASAEAVGAERDEWRVDPRPDAVGQGLHPVGRGDDRAALRSEHLRDVGRAGLLGRVEPVPAIDHQCVAPEHRP
jgi:glucose/arabinose dehydrogenase